MGASGGGLHIAECLAIVCLLTVFVTVAIHKGCALAGILCLCVGTLGGNRMHCGGFGGGSCGGSGGWFGGRFGGRLGGGFAGGYGGRFDVGFEGGFGAAAT